jgi:glycosyltransferase involved in cell wall biosynthesis
MSNEHPRVLVVNPSSDVYGSDLQMLESVSAMIERGWQVVATTPDEGPLIPLLEQRGASVLRVAYPVVRRENASLRGLVDLVVSVVGSLRTLLRTIRLVEPSVIYVNTVTVPWWLLAARLARVPGICHVHEAERDDGRIVRTALNAPLLLADTLIVISPAAMDSACEAVPALRKRARLIFNGVPGPESPPRAAVRTPGPRRLAVVGRLSPRKGTDVALEALAVLRAQGRDVVLEVCGTAFPGYEWFVEELEARAAAPDLAGSVTFSGYVRPVWGVLERAEVVLAPSLREPFGNAVVEAQLAARPVVAAAAMGHLVTVDDGRTGLLVAPGDARAMAAAVACLLDDDDLASSVANAARRDAELRFSVERYRREIVTALTAALRNDRGDLGAAKR